MNGSFDFGDAIVIIIVVIIIVVLRILDRNNRSLEKIKRYSEKIKGEISDFVDNKASDLKNMNIELDIHRKTSNEVLKRIGEYEKGFQHRLQVFDDLHGKISDYDAALKELNSMSLRVNENLQKIHRQSEFVDKLSAKLNSAADKLNQVEKRLPQLTEEFRELNEKSLKEVGQEAVLRIKDDVEKALDEVETVNVKISEFSQGIDDLERRAADIGDETIESLKQRTVSLVSDTDGDIDKLKQDLNEVIDEFRIKAESLEQSYQASLLEATSKSKDLEGAIFGKVKGFIEKRAEQTKSDVEKLISQGKADAENKLNSFSAKIDGWKTKTSAEINDFIQGLKKQYTTISDNTEKQMGSVRNSIQEITKSIDKWKADTLKSLEADKKVYEKNISSMGEDIGNSYAGIEKQVKNYEENLTYRFSRLEELGTEIDSLEESLRQSMEVAVENLKKNFKTYEASIDDLRAEGMKKAEDDVEQINVVISRLEQEILVLKEKAYENVSEKLQVFEDDFFNDLKQRNDKIDQEFEKLQDSLKSRIEDVSVEEAEKRIQIEKEYSENLRNELSEVQGKTFSMYEKFEDQVTGFQNRINERMNLTEIGLKGLEDEIKTEMIDIKNNATSYFKKEFADQSTSMMELIKKAERDVEGEISGLEESFAAGKKEISSVIENTQSDITVWQTKVLQEMNEAKENVHGDVELFRTDVQVTISSIREDFQRQRDDFMLANQEERNAMKKELTEISEQILDLENALRKRSESAIETFEQDFNNFSLEFQKKGREFQADIDQRIKDYRLSAKDIQDKIDGIQKKLYGKVEENYKTLSVTLQEIDKKQKSFLNQTKLFDRADSLKHTLMENIEDLKTELDRTEAQRDDVKEAEKIFGRIIKLGEEAAVKLDAFNQEKRRIEEMDGDFKKLINISQAVDVKLDQLTSSHDTLQDMQVRIRNLEELAKDVELKYERLEKKDNVLETTVNAVDKNFSKISDIENSMETVQGALTDVNARLKEAAAEIKTLASSKKEAEKALKQINELTAVLTDVETRMETMQKAREWLARTETRLEEVGKQAQEQVKLLGTIMKDSTSKKGDRGAPNMGAREVVTRLAHEGWSVKEIAQATKLSRGEVELILELLPKK